PLHHFTHPPPSTTQHMATAANPTTIKPRRPTGADATAPTLWFSSLLPLMLRFRRLSRCIAQLYRAKASLTIEEVDLDVREIEWRRGNAFPPLAGVPPAVRHGRTCRLGQGADHGLGQGQRGSVGRVCGR